MQAQNESVAKKGMLSSFIDIYSKEGITGLWRVSIKLQYSRSSIHSGSFIFNQVQKQGGGGNFFLSDLLDNNLEDNYI